MNRYLEQIEKLSWIIRNWILINQEPIIAKEDYYNTFGDNLNIKHGLCANAKFNGIPKYVREEMFRTYKNWSGSYNYPLSDFEDYSYIFNFTDTKERLDLAKHCLNFLNNRVKLYDIQIRKLDFIIENWELIEIKPAVVYFEFFDEFGDNLNFLHGLCRNCELEYLPIYIQDSMFMSFPKFSGNCLYPLSTYPKMVNCFTDTPERLELAKHCSKYLKNLVASIEKSGTI